jgi:phosphatidylinositol alpha-mannosyltransferase
MLERMIAVQQLGNVRLVGRKIGPELHAWYRWADAFVLPSDKEGMPLVLLEAMAAGLPIVATDVAGMRATVGDDALLARPDPGSLAASIDQLVADPALWRDLSHRSSARAGNFAWTSLVTSLRTMYDGVGP